MNQPCVHMQSKGASRTSQLRGVLHQPLFRPPLLPFSRRSSFPWPPLHCIQLLQIPKATDHPVTIPFVLQTNNVRTSWDAVWMAPEEIAKEGIMISPHLLDDHYTATLEVQILACPTQTAAQCCEPGMSCLIAICGQGILG